MSNYFQQKRGVHLFNTCQKTGKFGIKFFMLTDAEVPYLLNAKPYLSAQFDENRQGLQLGEHVALKLIEPFENSGYNITSDNFFTSLRLAHKLSDKRTTLVSTLSNNRREIPSELLSAKNRELKSSIHAYNSDSKAIMCNGKGKSSTYIAP
jgi:hypothetical protein